MNTDQISQAFLTDPTSSFVQFLDRHYPNLLPISTPSSRSPDLSPTATTIVTVITADAVVIAGDRRATVGSMISQRDIRKVFVADDYSAIGIAGSAGMAMDLIRLFCLELEHYEKIEGIPLTLEGKANRLSSMVRGNLALALQGFVIVPLFVGWDCGQRRPRIFSIDPTGGLYEETGYCAIGSGSVFAKGSLKKLYDPKASLETGIEVCIQALFDAADDDCATGGPDVLRRIYPLVITVSSQGACQIPDDSIARVTKAVLKTRAVRADGPEAKL